MCTKNLLIHALGLFLILFLTGCAQFTSKTFSMVSPDNLSKPSAEDKIELNEEFVAYQELGLLKVPYVYRLKPELYISEYENEEGVFYRGPEKALLQTSVEYENSGNKLNRVEGGIWVAKCDNKKSKFKADI